MGCPPSDGGTQKRYPPSPQPTPGVVKQHKSSGGSVDTTKTRSGPQRVRMCSGERPIGAAKGKQSDTEALCQPPPPPLPRVQRKIKALKKDGPDRSVRWTTGRHLLDTGGGGGLLRQQAEEEAILDARPATVGRKLSSRKRPETAINRDFPGPCAFSANSALPPWTHIETAKFRIRWSVLPRFATRLDRVMAI